MDMRTFPEIPKSALLCFAVFALGGCADTFHRQPLPPGSVGEKLEHAGANYQATEAMPGYRNETPNESMREVRDRKY
jgi:hypothetical protein